MNRYVVAEGASDVALLRRVIEGRVGPGVYFVDARGKSSAISMAQSLLVVRQAPLAVVMDADALDEARVREQEVIYEDLLKAYAGRIPLRLFLAVPEFESVLFDAPTALSRISRFRLRKEELREAVARPKLALQSFMRRAKIGSFSELVGRLDSKALDEIAKVPLLSGLIAFLQDPKEASSQGFHPAASHPAISGRTAARRPGF